MWTVPVTGSYIIKASGASGASGANGTKLGGLGAKMTGTFQINEGTKLKILVGQEGGTNTKYHFLPGGGGGGSFVTLLDNTPLVVAGGGGGGGGKLISQTVIQGRQQGTGVNVVEHRVVGVRCAMPARDKRIFFSIQVGVLGFTQTAVHG